MEITREQIIKDLKELMAGELISSTAMIKVVDYISKCVAEDYQPKTTSKIELEKNALIALVEYFGHILNDGSGKPMQISLEEVANDVIGLFKVKTTSTDIEELRKEFEKQFIEKIDDFTYPNLKQYEQRGSAPFHCTLCHMGEMDISDNKTKDGRYYCRCSYWEEPHNAYLDKSGGKWLGWKITKEEAQEMYEDNAGITDRNKMMENVWNFFAPHLSNKSELKKEIKKKIDAELSGWETEDIFFIKELIDNA